MIGPLARLTLPKQRKRAIHFNIETTKVTGRELGGCSNMIKNKGETLPCAVVGRS